MSDANFTPNLGKYKSLQPFRFWCQKVLPLVYDDSLSYYELLCKVVDYLNKTMEDVETLHGDVTNLHKAYVELQGYVNNYFNNLDVQNEINNKLDTMASDGSLSAILAPIVNNSIADLSAKVTALQSVISGLTPKGETISSNEVTQSRTTFDGITYQLLNERLLEEGLYFNDILNNIFKTKRLSYNNLILKENTAILNGVEETNNNYKASDFIVLQSSVLFLHNELNLDGGGYISFYDENKTYISQTVISGNGGKATAPSNAFYFRITVGKNTDYILSYGDVKLSKTMATNFALFKGAEYKGKLFYIADGVATNDYNENYTLHAPEINTSNCYFIYSEKNGNYFTELNNDFTAKEGYTLQGLNKCVPVSAPFSVLSSGLNGIKVPLKELTPVFNNVVFYGDSITCLGNDINSKSWQYYFLNYFNNKKLISVGIGGTAFKWDSGANGYDLSDFTSGNSLPVNATIKGDAVHSSFCSYERISKTIPKNATCVIVMGGTNDIDSELGNAEFNENANYDGVWRSASNTGDFNINTLIGGILSTIMKIRYHVPNAHIIMCSPIGGRGSSGEASRWSEVIGANGLTTIDIRDAIEKSCIRASVDFIDVFGTSGISIYNRGSYIKDIVHPNDYGMMCIGRSICQGVNKLIYKPNSDFAFSK